MRFRECKRCGGHAVAVQGPSTGPVCMGCIDQEGPPHEYICSIRGCGNQPVILAVLKGDERATVLVCERHFNEVRDSVTSYLEVPPWLTEGEGFLAGDGGVVFQFEVGPGEGRDDRGGGP